MKACEAYIDPMMRSVDGEMTAREEAALHRHLEDCPGCRAFYRDCLLLQQGLAGTEEEPPETLAPAIMRSIRREQRRYSPGAWLRRGRFTLLAAAAAVVLLIFARFGVDTSQIISTGDVPVEAGEHTEETAATADAVGEALLPAPDRTDTAGSSGRQADVRMAAGPSLRELLEEAGCGGTVYVVSGENSLEELLPDARTVGLSGGQTAYSCEADRAQALFDSGALTVTDTLSLDGSGVWLVME